MDQLDEENEAKWVTVSDRTLALAGPTCPVSGNSERVARSYDRTLARRVTGRWHGAFGQC